MPRKLFVWVEGASDARFFEAVLRPLLEKRYNSVEVRTYATLKKTKVVNILRGIREAGNDYILVADIDQERCVTAKKGGTGKEVLQPQPEANPGCGQGDRELVSRGVGR